MASRTDAPLKGLRAAACDTESPVAELDLSPKRTVCRRGLGSPRPQQLGCLHRSNSQRRKARRSTGPAADQVRTGDQPQGSQGATDVMNRSAAHGPPLLEQAGNSAAA